MPRAERSERERVAFERVDGWIGVGATEIAPGRARGRPAARIGNGLHGEGASLEDEQVEVAGLRGRDDAYRHGAP